MSHNPYKLQLKRFSTHKQIIDAIGADKIVLDIGCNDGYIGAHAAQSSKFYGIDYMPESVKKAKKIYKDVIVYDLNKLHPLPWNKRFDVIIFADVLEHVNRPEDVLKYFASNYLAAGGKIIISVPNIANWRIRLSLLLGEFNYTESGILDKTHIHFYTYKTARNLARNSGLHILNERAGASFFGPLAVALPLLRGIVASSIIVYAEKSSSK